MLSPTAECIHNFINNTQISLHGPPFYCSLLTPLIPLTIDTLQPISESPDPAPPSDPAPLCVCAPPLSQSPTATLQSTNTHTQSSSSSSGDGSLFRQRGSQAAQPDETGRVPPYVDFTQFYRLWGSDHSEGQGLSGDLGPQ